MRVLLVSPSCYPALAYGGPPESVYRLANALADADCEVKVLTTDANGTARLAIETNRDVTISARLTIRYCSRTFGEASSIPLLPVLHEWVAWSDIVHLNAVYSFTTIPTLLVSAILDKPLVWSPRGAFQEWAGVRRKRLKRVWDLVCRGLRPVRVGLHATSRQEQLAIERRFHRGLTAVIPNIVDLPSIPSRSCRQSPELRLLYLGRLHPIKALENLIEACAMLASSATPWQLTIAGDGHPDYVASLRSLMLSRGLAERVHLAGTVAGDAKERLFERSDVLILPSHSENFGLVVPEALAHGVPVIASDRTPWSSLESVGCGICAPNDAGSLADAVLRIRLMDRVAMGDAGRRWVADTFTSVPVATQMREFYVRTRGLAR